MINFAFFEYFTVYCTTLLSIFLFVALDNVAAEEVIHLEVAVKGTRSDTFLCLWANKYFVWDHIKQIWYLLLLQAYQFHLQKKFSFCTVIYVKYWF